MRTKSTPSLRQRLETLLSERKAVRALVTRYRFYFETKNYSDERRQLEKQISAIVSDGLPWNEDERRYYMPQAQHVAEALYNLPATFSCAEAFDNPSQVWRNGLVAGVLITGWHPSIKLRLEDLTGPLDATLGRMFAA